MIRFETEVPFPGVAMPKKNKRANSTGSVYVDKSKGLFYAALPIGFKTGEPEMIKRSSKTKTGAYKLLAELQVRCGKGARFPLSASSWADCLMNGWYGRR
jgi:hypothetical protein